MSLTLQQIITEADILVPNGYSNTEKVAWLNSINSEFFDVVKIPVTETFTSIAGTKTYTLTANIKEKTLDKVMVGNQQYRSLNYEDVRPAHNWFTFNDTTKVLALSAAPSRSGLLGIGRYRKSANTTFTTSGVSTQKPDAPDEYHWIYTIALAEYIAMATQQFDKAADYRVQYQKATESAALNHQRGNAS